MWCAGLRAGSSFGGYRDRRAQEARKRRRENEASTIPTPTPPPLSRARDLAVSISSIFFTLLQLRGPFYIFRLVSSSMNDVRSVLKHLDNTVHCNLNSILLLDIKVT